MHNAVRIVEITQPNSPYLPGMNAWLEQIFPEYAPARFHRLLAALRHTSGRHQLQIFAGLDHDQVVGLIQVFYRPWQGGLIADIDLLGVLEPYRRSGLAQALVQRALREARRMALSYSLPAIGVASLIDPQYPPIMRLHEKLGGQVRQDYLFESGDRIVWYPLAAQHAGIETPLLAEQMREFGGLLRAGLGNIESASQPALSREELAAGFRRLGLGAGDAVEVHSSLSSLGPVDGGAAAVIQALVDVVGAEGAIVMSAYTVTLPLPLTEAEKQRGVIAKVRFLDEDSTERTGMGLIADTFRVWPGAVLGKNPHRVCAWGKDADLHSRGYRHLLDIDGWVLLIGVDIHRCSAMHLAEEPETWPQALREYSRLPEDIQRDYPADQWYVQYNDPPEDGWGKVQAEAERRGLVQRGRIGQAECMLFKARAVVEIYAKWLREDPLGLFGIAPEVRQPGNDAGKVGIAPDFDAPLPEFDDL